MAKCNLRIELEPRAAWRRDEPVRGRVIVEVDGSVRCDGLVLRSCWATHGKGNRAEGQGEKQTLFQGEWSSSTTSEYPFEIRLPDNGPVPYRGHYLNVGWFVNARADIPWKIDPRAEVEVPTEPAPGVEPDWEDQFQETDGVPKDLREALEEAEKEATSGPLGKLFGWLLVVGCLGALAYLLFAVFGSLGFGLWTAVKEVRAAMQGEQSWGSTIPALAGLGVAALVLLAIAAGIARVVIRRQRLGEISVSLEPAVAKPGEDFRVSLRGSPGRTLTLNRATLRLVGKERVVRGSGTDKKTYTHELHSETLEIAATRPLSARIPFQIDGTLRIPDDAPPSLGLRDNEIQWVIEASLDVADCPDWSGKKKIVVAPRSG